jgi:hypothetical protein
MKNMTIPYKQIPEIFFKNKKIQFRWDLSGKTPTSKKLMVFASYKLIIKFE